MKQIFEELLQFSSNIECIDTHEHLSAFEDLREKPTDVLHEYLNHYFNRDLLNAGLPAMELDNAMNIEIPIMERWMRIEPYWNLARKTGYGQTLDISVQELYSLPGIKRTTIEELDCKFKKTLSGGQYQTVLKEKCKIKTSLLVDIAGLGKPCDSNYFRRVFDITYFVFPKSFEEMNIVQSEAGIRISSIEDWKDAFDICLKKEMEAGAAAVKSSLAYERPLYFPRVTAYAAEEDFNAMYDRRHMPDWSNRSLFAGANLQNYMMHHVLRRLNSLGLVIQIHTGLLEGTGNFINHSDPSLLSNLFLEYDNVKFDIFHIGYPFEKKLTAIAKMFPNVFIDMCWAHVISPSACVQIFKEWMDTIPVNKISAFGGDYRIVDAVVGHLLLARKNVCRALTGRIDDGLLDLDEAKNIIGRVFYENPKKLFCLKDL